jgi:hypothetical protein
VACRHIPRCVNHPNLALQVINVAETDTAEARLIFWKDELVAVVSQLGPLHEHLEGHWFIEAAFGLEIKGADTFPSLDALIAFVAGLCARSDAMSFDGDVPNN